MTIAVIDQNGNYIQSFEDGYSVQLQAGQKVINHAPYDARQKWLGDRWSDAPASPNWVAFRRTLMGSDAYNSLKKLNFSPEKYDLIVNLSVSLIVTPPNVELIASLWNQLDRATLNPQRIQSLRDAIAANNIPLSIDNQGTITVVG